jgi:hypothetical protein
MKPILKNFIAVIIGVFAGGVVNMSLIMISDRIIPPPDGSNLLTMEGLKASMHLMQPKHFIMPFLAHALGTFSGALLAALIAAKHNMRIALGISVWFMIGGLINIIMLPSPIWFTLLDLSGAYLPFGFLAGKLVQLRMKQKETH